MFSPSTTEIDPFFLANRIKRLVAFCIDLFPIYFVTFLIYRQFYGYDAMMEELMADQQNVALQEAVISVTSRIFSISAIIYLIYSCLMEGSENQATFGKKLMSLKVVHIDGTHLSLKEAFWRNAFKVFSHAAFSVGFFWILLDRQKRGWHDIMGKTFVVEQAYHNESSDEPMIKQEDIKILPKHLAAAKTYTSASHTLREGNQSNLLYPADLSLIDFEKIKKDNLDPQSRLSQYQFHLNDAVLVENTNVSDELLWNNITYGQKLLRVFTLFDSHLTTIDLFSFLFVSGEFTFAMVGVLKEINADPLLQDYMTVVEELRRNMKTFSAHKKIFLSPLATDQEKEEAYETARRALQSTKIIDRYYREEQFAKVLAQQMCNYIEAHPHMYIRTHS